MLTVSDISLSFGKRFLFKNVNIKFTPGNCYGLIGANGSGKSTLLKIFSGDQEADSGDIIIPSGQRLAVLQQDHYAFDAHTVMNTVIMGHKELYSIMVQREEIYSKSNMTDEEGMKVAVLEGEFAEMGGYESESEAATLLAGLGVDEKLYEKKMAEVEDNIKVRILIAQALFGNPDILLLDEPTNHLDLESITWLENFLLKFQNTVVVVSHDRHFLNKVCTHIADIDYQQVRLFVGNYEFWWRASQLAAKQRKEQQKKSESKASELKEFIQRFSSNAARSKQATSRKKELDKLELKDLPQTSRRFPYVNFKPERDPGKMILEIKGLAQSFEGKEIFKDVDIIVENGDKIAFVGPNNLAKTIFFDTISSELEPQAGEYKWGVTINMSYFPKDNTNFFDKEINMTDWLRQYSQEEDESFVRGFLGRMLFSGDESLKSVQVLSGGERVRCMLSRMMLNNPNVLIFDEPTAHLDLEAITSLNSGIEEFPGPVMINTHDHQLLSSVANRVIEFTPGGVIDRKLTFDDYLESEDVAKLRDKMYQGQHIRLTL
ncbi:MAG: ATP-binding cassette domain-containing protein [Spirochaetaceae bacterium]|nr:ATP-binding cassette domain-containing protein [Spirochaetaceae bacterium]